ncbi:MAG: hypothetical protein ABGZ17_04450 [Planctomycetaceae bacterium]
MRITLTPLSRTTTRLCEEVESVRYEPTLPTIAVAVVDQKMVLLLGRTYMEIPVYPRGDVRRADGDYLREQFLLHEAWHVLLGHHRLRANRKRYEWNLACDAVIHHRATIDLDAMRTTGMTPVTFETLDMMPCRPEFAYERLLDRAQPQQMNGADGPSGEETHSGCGRPSESDLRRCVKGTGDIDDDETALNEARRARVVDAVMAGVREDWAAAGKDTVDLDRAWIPAKHRTSPGHSDEVSGGRRIGQRTDDQPAWVADVVAHLRPVSGRTARGRTYRREHRNGHALLPGRGRVGGVQPVFFLDASSSISDLIVQEMLTALRVTPIFAEAMTFVFDTTTRGPFLASDAEGIRQAVRESGGGTRIAGAWTDAADQVDPACTRVWITDGLDMEGELPDPWADDIWVGVGWHPDPVLMTRDELEHRVETWREEYEHV